MTRRLVAMDRSTCERAERMTLEQLEYAHQKGYEYEINNGKCTKVIRTVTEEIQ